VLLVQQSTIARLAKAARPEAGAPPIRVLAAAVFFLYLHGKVLVCMDLHGTVLARVLALRFAL